MDRCTNTISYGLIADESSNRLLPHDTFENLSKNMSETPFCPFEPTMNTVFGVPVHVDSSRGLW